MNLHTAEPLEPTKTVDDWQPSVRAPPAPLLPRYTRGCFLTLAEESLQRVARHAWRRAALTTSPSYRSANELQHWLVHRSCLRRLRRYKLIELVQALNRIRYEQPLDESPDGVRR